MTPCQRAMIIGARIAGASYRTIAKTFDLPVTTVRYTIKLADKRDEQVSQPRSGRPEISSSRDKRQILRLTRSNTDWSYAKLLRELHESDIKIGKATVVRLLHKESIAKQKKRKSVSEASKGVVNDK